MLSTAQPPPRGPRGSTGSTPQARGRGRGGIQKRRAERPARVDRDGDLVMDAATTTNNQPRSGRGRISPARNTRTSSGPSGRPAPGGRGNQVSDRARQSIMRGLGAKQANVLESRITDGPTRLQIGGLSESKAARNPDGGLDSLLGFLERKASGLDSKSNRAVKIKKSKQVGDSVFITASPGDIAAIQRLDGFTFAGAILSIRAVDPSDNETEVSPKTLEVKEQLRSVLASRYDEPLKLMNLNALATDPGLLKMGIFDTKNPHKIFAALMVVCAEQFKTPEEKRNAIVSVTLADNGLENVNLVKSLADTLPDLKNIDLSRNNFKDLRALNAWRYCFRGLENLVLIGNPIENQLSTLKDDILRRYPKLHTLNNVMVRTPEQLAAVVAEDESVPFPICSAQFNDVDGVGANFVTQFLTLYDTDRPALLASYYDNDSIYSLAINMTAPRSTEMSVPVQPWAEYTKHSRNLEKINHLGARMNRQSRGVQAIQSVWTSLPATRHPDFRTQGEKYMIECQRATGLADPTGQNPQGVDGLTITMHGEFEDDIPNITEKSLRSFSRTFVLGPGTSSGPQIRIVSDMLALRAWGPLPQVGPAAISQPAATVVPLPQPIMTPEQAELAQKEAIATQLMEKTGMTMQYTVLCLDGAGWNLEQAFTMFLANKANLPQEAWIDGIAR